MLIKNIGFELELAISDRGLDKIEKLNKENKLDLDFSGDGSIRTTDECPNDLEIKTNEPKNYTKLIWLAGQLFKVLKDLERNKEALVNRSCGLHFHFDARELKVSELNNVFNGWRNWGENWFYDILPQSRRDNEYSRSIQNRTFRSWLGVAEKFWSMSPHFLRESRIPTLEYRLFNSTLNAYHFLNYLRLIKLFVDSLGKESDFSSKVNKNKTLVGFIESRRKVYSQ